MVANVSQRLAPSHVPDGAPLVPPTIVPPQRPLGRIATISRFVRNPLLVVPAAAYHEDFVHGSKSPPTVWISAPDLVKAVLLDNRETFQKLVQIRLLSPLLGKGILTSEGDDWKWQRQASAPMFRHQELMRFVPTFVDATKTLATRWQHPKSGAVQDIEQDMTHVTFDIISRTLLPSADNTLAPVVEDSSKNFQRGGAWQQLYAFLRLPSWLPKPSQSATKDAVASMRGAVHRMLAERRQLAQPPDDLMHRLMGAHAPDSGQPMTDDQLVDNLLTFYLAGHETTAKALTWTLFLLSRSPHYAAALRDEVQRIAGDSPIAAEHIDKLVLTQQVIKESMRIYPPVPMMSRQAVKDTVLGGRPVRAGTSVIMSIYAIHRHRALWERPDVFDPTRFAPEKERAISRYQYMPFGAGPRICIGMSFAMIEATAILATLIRSYRFEPTEHTPTPVARVTLLPGGGMPLRVIPAG